MPSWHLFTTGRFGAALLARLAGIGIAPKRVYTYANERIMGRGLQKGVVPALVAARDAGITIVDCEQQGLSSIFNEIPQKEPVLICDYGRKIPKDVVEQRNCINIHPSLLPRWRGAAPIHWTLLSGDESAGVTLFLMNERIDAGDIILQRQIPVEPQDDYGSLEERLVCLAADMTSEYLKTYTSLEIALTPQDEQTATYAKKIQKEDMAFSWQDNARSILNKVRAFSPYWGAFTIFKGKRLKVFKADVIEDTGSTSKQAGTIVGITGDSIDVKAQGGILRISAVQLEGKNRVSAGAFINGCRLKVGDTLS